MARYRQKKFEIRASCGQASQFGAYEACALITTGYKKARCWGGLLVLPDLAYVGSGIGVTVDLVIALKPKEASLTPLGMLQVGSAALSILQ